MSKAWDCLPKDLSAEVVHICNPVQLAKRAGSGVSLRKWGAMQGPTLEWFRNRLVCVCKTAKTQGWRSVRGAPREPRQCPPKS